VSLIQSGIEQDIGIINAIKLVIALW